MFFYRYNRGPRGRMNGHGGFRPGLLILGIFALMGFAPIALAALSGLFIGGIAVFGGLLSAVAGILTSLGAEAFSLGGVAVGIVIGLLLYNRNRTRKGNAADHTEAENGNAADTGAQAAEEYYPMENYRSFGA